MGAASSYHDNHRLSLGENSDLQDEFPNHACRSQTTEPCGSWKLLHLCTVEQWIHSHAVAAGFMERRIVCSGQLGRDCSVGFCMNRQGVITFKSGSIFSFRRKSKFNKLSEHFEYYHIPAHLSSIQNFRVQTVVCCNGRLAILQLVRGTTSQFGMIDIVNKKFMGVFGRTDFAIDALLLTGAISSSGQKCILKLPFHPSPEGDELSPIYSINIYDITEKPASYVIHGKRFQIELVGQIALHSAESLFTFDPRFSWCRLAITDFVSAPSVNTLSLLNITDTHAVEEVATNEHVDDSAAGRSTHGAVKVANLSFTPEGAALIVVAIETICNCPIRRKSTLPVECNIYVLNPDTAEACHCIQYQRFTCYRHLCPVNYQPIYSRCSSRMALVLNTTESPHYSKDFVQVFKLPRLMRLKSLCRSVILQRITSDSKLELLPIPDQLRSYLQFVPDQPLYDSVLPQKSKKSIYQK